MKRRDFLKTVGFSAAMFAGSGSLSSCGIFAKDKKFNFILINVDDLGWTDVACFGSRYYETPNIDRLCAQGMKFTNAYASCAVCSPTRASLMTGRYPARVGVTDWIHHLDRQADTAVEKGANPAEYVGGRNRQLLCPPNPYWMELDEVTIAEILKSAGYVTCHIGKWHLGPYYWFPDKQGFDINIGGSEIGQPPSYFDPYYLNESRPSISTLPPRRRGEYLTDRESDEAVRFIKEHADKQFFLNMCHYAVHTPLQAKENILSKYEGKETTNHKNATYAAMIESVDRAVGQIMAVLDELNLSDRTMVIFTSDNGGLLGSTDNAPLRSGKGYPYEGGIRVPLIIRLPGVVDTGSVCDAPVTSVDYFPTMCETAGLKLPGDRAIDGESLVPLLKQTGPLKSNAIFWHFPHYRGRDVVPYSIIRKGDWKLIKRYEGISFELFNLKDDLGENQDLSEQMPEKVEELDVQLTTWLKDTNAKLPRENPDFVRGT